MTELNGHQLDYVPDPPSPHHPPLIPRGASETFVYDEAARHELEASARRVTENSDAAQWIHAHRHGERCNERCGPLDER